MRCTSESGSHQLGEPFRVEMLYGSVAVCEGCGVRFLVERDETKARLQAFRLRP